MILIMGKDFKVEDFSFKEGLRQEARVFKTNIDNLKIPNIIVPN